jgi:hypothetical protein
LPAEAIPGHAPIAAKSNVVIIEDILLRREYFIGCPHPGSRFFLRPLPIGLNQLIVQSAYVQAALQPFQAL